MNKSCYFIGITGGIGSGKTTVSNILRDNNYFVFDSDQFSKRILSSNKDIWVYLEQIVGCSITTGENLDFKLIGEFFDKNPKLEMKFEMWYQEFLGKKILDETLTLKEMHDIVFLDIPFLLEKGIANKLDYLWIIESNLNKYYERIKMRNNYNAQKIEHLISISQINKNLLPIPYSTIYNNDGIEELEVQIKSEIYQLQKNFKVLNIL